MGRVGARKHKCLDESAQATPSESFSAGGRAGCVCVRRPPVLRPPTRAGRLGKFDVMRGVHARVALDQKPLVPGLAGPAPKTVVGSLPLPRG